MLCCPNSGPHLALMSKKYMNYLPELTRVLAGRSMEEKGLLHQAPKLCQQGSEEQGLMRTETQKLLGVSREAWSEKLPGRTQGQGTQEVTNSSLLCPP